MSAYGCIWLFLPYADQKLAQRSLDQQTQQLVSILRTTQKGDSEPLLINFIRQTGADISLFDPNGESVSPFTFEKTAAEMIPGTRYPFRFPDSDEYVLITHYNPLRSDEIADAVRKSIPFVTLLVILLSAVSAFAFSRYTTRPIIRISGIADKIANLDFSWYCPDLRDDEIGVLSRSINELSDRLHKALDEIHRRNDFLEDELLLEKERERRRMLFFSGVSHELKTPIAIVIGQLEGMQAQIGIYKDRETYLARSAEILQSLNDFIKEVLLVSHLDMKAKPPAATVNLSEMLESLIVRYMDYAEPLSINFSKEIEPAVLTCGDELLLKKALGNVIGNAISYSPEHSYIRIRLSRMDRSRKEATDRQDRNFYNRHPEYLELLPELYQTQINNSNRSINWYHRMPLMILKAEELVGGEEKMDEILRRMYADRKLFQENGFGYTDFLRYCGLTEEDLYLE